MLHDFHFVSQTFFVFRRCRRREFAFVDRRHRRRRRRHRPFSLGYVQVHVAIIRSPRLSPQVEITGDSR